MDKNVLLPEDDRLAVAAWQARDRAYAPYSSFRVGAALRTKSGQIFTGCNVENLSFGLTICAERVAIGTAVAAGETEFEAVVVVAESSEPVSPCGACRQVMAEFGSDIRVTSLNREGTAFQTTVGELLPRSKTGILG
jgi:cytidine deaminase